MSHLIIEQGSEVGKEVDVPAAGMKFGRSPANDLVLDDPAVMLFHGRFFFKSDGFLWVTDFGAGEKTTVGGEPVDEYQLKVGDLVEVGATAFRIINIALEQEEPAAAPVAAPQKHERKEPEAEEHSEEIDLGFKREKKSRRAPDKKTEHKPASLTARLMQVSVILLFLIVLMIVGPSLMELSKADVSNVQQEERLTLAYERVMGTTKNIFRYRVDLDDKGIFSVRIDDLKTNRHQIESKEIPQSVIEQLSHGIAAAGFFDVDSDYAGTSDNQYDLYNIAVQRNHRFHHIQVLNWTPPSAIQRTTQLIEDFVVSELGISFTWKLDPEELMQLAEHAFEVGEARYAERDVRYGNLATAITQFKEAILYLETIEPKPAIFHRASGLLEAAQIEQTVRYDDYLFRSDRAIRLKNWDEAAKYLRILSELIPDRSDPRYEKINAKLLNVEQHLR
ncbi:FHA domain-containing protein [Pontiellaceae bacterium B12219]|nr:FHA domain-containing protein [Pontiellaceae bacterium B12219]